MKTREIVGFPGYKVSKTGKVYSRMKNGGGLVDKWHERKGVIASDGYVYVNLHRNNRRHTRPVHQLVLEAFVGPRPEGKVTRHFPDRDPTNNRLENLSWSTNRRNAKDRRLHGTQQTVLTEDKVLLFVRKYRKWPHGTKERRLVKFAREHGVSVYTLRHVLSGKNWSWLTGISA